MADVVAIQHPGRHLAAVTVMTRGFMGRPEPLCDERGEPIDFAPRAVALFACRTRDQAEAMIRDATHAANRAASAASFLEELN